MWGASKESSYYTITNHPDLLQSGIFKLNAFDIQLLVMMMTDDEQYITFIGLNQNKQNL